MKTWLLVLGCLLAFASSADSSRREVWVWKDADGVTHYSDYPAPGARKIVLNGSAPTSSDGVAPAPVGSRPAAPAAAAEVTYTSLEILSPQNDESFFEPDATVSVLIRSEPDLAPTHRLTTYLDGKLLSGTDTSGYNVSNLERGAHTLASAIVDKSGKELIRSAPVVFHMKQTTMNNPRNQGPAQRPQAPPPRPTPKPAGSKAG